MLCTNHLRHMRLPVTFLSGFVWRYTWAAVPEFLRSLMVAHVDRLAAALISSMESARPARLNEQDSRVLLDYNLFNWIIEGDRVYVDWAARQSPPLQTRPHSGAAWQLKLARAFELNCGVLPRPAEQHVRCVLALLDQAVHAIPGEVLHLASLGVSACTATCCKCTAAGVQA